MTPPSSDGFLVCPDHGDIYWAEDGDADTLVIAENFKRLNDRAPIPYDGMLLECFCGKPLDREVRPRVRRVA